jgi:hypothetical protein
MNARIKAKSGKSGRLKKTLILKKKIPVNKYTKHHAPDNTNLLLTHG